MTREKNRCPERINPYRERLVARGAVSTIIATFGYFTSMFAGAMIPITILDSPPSIREIRDPADRREAELIYEEQYSSLSKYAQNSTMGIVGLGALAYFGLGTTYDLSRIIKRQKLQK